MQPSGYKLAVIGIPKTNRKDYAKIKQETCQADISIPNFRQ